MFDLSSIPNATLLDGLEDAHIRELGEIAEPCEARKGERLIVRGEIADVIYLVRAGCFALTVTLRDLGEDAEVAIEELDAGKAFGWSTLVEPKRSIYSVYCIEDGAVVAFDGRALQSLMESDTSLGYRLCSNLSTIIGQRVRVLQDLWSQEVEQSTARVRFWESSAISSHWHTAVDEKRVRRSWKHPFAGERGEDPPGAGR